MLNEDQDENEEENPYKFLGVDIQEECGLSVTVVSERWLVSDIDGKNQKNVLVYPKLKREKLVSAIRSHDSPPKTVGEFRKSSTQWNLFEHKFRQIFGERHLLSTYFN